MVFGELTVRAYMGSQKPEDACPLLCSTRAKELSPPGGSTSHRGVKNPQEHKFQLLLVTLGPMTCEVTGTI